MRTPTVRRRLAALALGSFLLACACGSAAASGGGTTTTSTTTGSTTTTSTTSSTSKASTGTNWVGVAQTVVVTTSSSGQINGTPRVFTQFSANGHGPVTLKVPMSSAGFRNLSGFGSAPIKNGYAVWNLHLTGPTSQRSMAHFPTDRLPLKVTAAYELNGKKVDAKHVVGKTGELKVTYVIDNVTTKATKVTFTNVLGGKETTTVKAPVPIAAIVDVTVPPSFTNLKAPGASASGNGNGSSSASWTLFLFNPLGGVKQSVTYQAHVTNAVVPSATVEAAPLAPHTIKPLPPISEPGAPAVPAVSLGGNLAKIQVKLQAERALLAGKAAAALRAFKQVAVPELQGVSGQAAALAGNLPAASAGAETASVNAQNQAARLAQASAGAADAAARAADVQGGLHQAAAEAADAAARMADVRTSLDALPPAVRGTPAYRGLHRRVVDLELGLTAHADRLRVKAAHADLLRLKLTGLSSVLATASSAETNVVAPAARDTSAKLNGLVPTAGALSTRAAAAATAVAHATLTPSKKRHAPIHTKRIGGGARLDKAVGQLDGEITKAADKVDSTYAYLRALDQRAAESRLPAGNAQGATAQAGAFVYSISGANNTAHQTHLATFIGGFVLIIGIGFGIGFYRIRRGMPSSLKPPKVSKAAAPAPPAS
jgi:hypothetical protein